MPKKDMGITFKPKLVKNTDYAVEGTFQLRNRSQIEERMKKEALIEEYNSSPYFDSTSRGNVDHSVDRLYNSRIEKHFQKQSHDPTKSKYRFEDDVRKDTQELDRLVSKSKQTATGESFKQFTFNNY